MRHLLALLVILSAAGLAGCTHSSTKAADQEKVSPTASGAREDPEVQAFLREFVAIRGAIDLAAWRDFQGLYYATVNHARHLEPDEGAAFLNRELPALLENVIDENRRALAGIQAVSPETRYGKQFRDLQIEAISFNIEAFGNLHDRFAGVETAPGAGIAWTALEAWADQTNPQIEEFDKRLVLFYGRLPAPFRQAFDKGMEAFGVGA